MVISSPYQLTGPETKATSLSPMYGSVSYTTSAPYKRPYTDTHESLSGWAEAPENINSFTNEDPVWKELLS